MRLIIATALALLSSADACAQSAGKEEIPAKKLAVTPAAEASPALKHRLLPLLGEMRPGNAALLYQRAHSPEWFGSLRRMPDFEKMHELLEMPLAKLPRERAAALTLDSMLKEIDMAARRTNCDWEMIDRIRDDGFGLLIPDVQGFRTYGQLLSLRTRQRLLERDYPKAVHSLQTHLALARHVSEAPILINALVAIAIANLALNDLEALAQQDGSPNLYWAMADLPRPLISLRKAMEGERIMIDVILPGIGEALKDPARAPLTVEQIEQGLKQMSFLGHEPLTTKLGLVFLATRSYPKARAELLRNGFTAEQVDAMPVIQVGLMHARAEYDRVYDDIVKWHSQPAWLARAGYKKSIQAMGKAREAMDMSALPSLIVPAMERVHDAQTRLERRLAMLQIIEALRMHAAATGRFPETLAELKDLPLPLDPMTGQPFQYSLAEGRAMLVGPPPTGMPADLNNSARYELTLAGGKK